MSDRQVVARSPIAPAEPVVRADGWEVSGRRAAAGLTIIDCSPLTKVQLRAPAGGRAAALLGVRFGRAARADWAGRAGPAGEDTAGEDTAGTLVVGSGPGEWLLLAAPGPGQAAALDPGRFAAQAPGESVTWVDLTHGRALVRLTGPCADGVLAKLCGVDLGDDVTPDGAAFRTSVAALATDVIRDDLPGPGETARSYLLHCERSSGQYLFDALLRAGAEFGLEIDGFRMPDALPARPVKPSRNEAEEP